MSEPTPTNSAYDRPQPPPGLVTPTNSVPTSVPPLPTTTPPTATSAPPGELREVGVTFSLKWFEWMPAIPLTLAFLLTFFSWVGAYPGGHAVFSQSAWDAVGSSISANVTRDLIETEKTLIKATKSSWWLLPYLLLLVLTLALAWIDRLVENPTVLTMPGPLVWLVSVWHLRFAALTGLCVLLLVLLVLQWMRGLGLQHAMDSLVPEEIATKLASSAGTEKKELEVKAGMEIGKFAVRTTTYLSLAILVHIVAVLGMLGRVWLANRGSSASPRLVLRY